MTHRVTRKLVRLVLEDKQLQPIVTVEGTAEARRTLVHFLQSLPANTVAILTFEGEVEVVLGVDDDILALVQQ